ncbi:hypothetical protein QTO34_015380 [Cnephaeus nilssonii]|uniref:C2H2-type domain-containing protein n=1 Tax=Cnephaeus nilssonii TaxID=3371016 RepID=A0AA40LT11_CNENI|nr:hypothetical protein QTO34_015380 [Eptesicus nilssonii]
MAWMADITIDSVAFEDVAVNFTLEKKLYRDVMRETFRNVASIGKIWEEHDIENHYKNQGRKLRSQMVEKVCGSKESTQCGENFSLISNLSLNNKTTGVKPCECSVCGKVFMQHSSLNRHIRCHTGHKAYEFQKYGEKPYKCKECGKAFSYLQYFEKHERNHSVEKTYKYKEHGKAFNCPCSLGLRGIMVTGDKTYVCKHCGKAYTSYSFLLRHKRIHKEEKPYVCKICGQTFYCFSHVQAHERTHTGEKPYECKQCGKAHRDPSSLKIHERIHTGEKPYELNNVVKPTEITVP